MSCKFHGTNYYGAAGKLCQHNADWLIKPKVYLVFLHAQLNIQPCKVYLIWLISRRSTHAPICRHTALKSQKLTCDLTWTREQLTLDLSRALNWTLRQKLSKKYFWHGIPDYILYLLPRVTARNTTFYCSFIPKCAAATNIISKHTKPASAWRIRHANSSQIHHKTYMK